jgi:transposase
MRLYRTFSRDFKLRIVRELQAGTTTRAHLCREHNLAPTVLTRWKQEYEQRGEEAFTAAQPAPTSESEALAARVAQLERFCGQLAWENALLKKTLEQHQ